MAAQKILLGECLWPCDNPLSRSVPEHASKSSCAVAPRPLTAGGLYYPHHARRRVSRCVVAIIIMLRKLRACYTYMYFFFCGSLHQLDSLHTEEGVPKPHPGLQSAATFDELRKRPLQLQTQAAA